MTVEVHKELLTRQHASAHWSLLLVLVSRNCMLFMATAENLLCVLHKAQHSFSEHIRAYQTEHLAQ